MCRYISSVSDKMTTTAVPSVGRGVAHTSAVGGRPRLGTHIDTCRYIQTHLDTYRHISTQCAGMLPAGLALLQNLFQHFASLLIIGSTGGVLVILLTWFRYRVEHNVRSVVSTSKLCAAND